MTLTEAANPIGRRYLHDEVADQLRTLIISGELEPRSRVNEAALCQRFGISRTPLREAIKLLGAEGLLELLPNRGARVAAISLREVDEVLEVIAALEGAAGELACQRIDDAGVEAIAALHDTMVAHWAGGDVAGYFALNREIHESIMRASGNTELQALYRTLSGRIQRARYSAAKTPDQWTHAIRDHEEMVELLRKRDAEGLGALMRRHVRSKRRIILSAYGEDGPL